ncbi:MAG: hypothetical protein WCB33_06130, partial [Bradyrhizobium sp.]
GLFRFHCPTQFAGARERNRPRPLVLPREIRVRARNEPAQSAQFCRDFSQSKPSRLKEDRMAATACLITLALGGLILIVLWEIFS